VASQKGARFVRFCDAFNLPIVTLVDTPGFLPGKDLEWRGMIRHGAELVFAYAEASVPRLAVLLRKATGGAYIVMDSKGIGNTLCLAWPGAQPAVMGARGAVQILHRRAGEQERGELEAGYAERFLAPWEAAERGYVDMVIDPADTRSELAGALLTVETERERVVGRKHDAGPL
jgi:acetyl-CoA carboxylase carboxyltransferase component